MAIDPQDDHLDLQKIPSDPDGKGLIAACSNLVIVDTETGTVHVAHHTVTQFIRKSPDRFGNANEFLSQICLTYLSFSDFENQVSRIEPKVTIPAPSFSPALYISQLTGIGRGLYNLFLSIRSRAGREESLPSLYLQAVASYQRKRPAADLQDKYKLLDYVIEHWLSHLETPPWCRISSENQFSICDPPVLTDTEKWYISAFRRLCLSRDLPFEFRPWGENKGPKDLPYMTMFLWALRNCHGPLLELFPSVPTLSEAKTLRDYLATQDDHDENGALFRALLSSDDILIATLLRHKDSLVKVRGLFEMLAAHDEPSACKTMKLLLDAKRYYGIHHIDILSSHGINALCNACSVGNSQMVKLLLDQGVAPDCVQIQTDDTPILKTAKAAWRPESRMIMEALLHAGARLEGGHAIGHDVMDCALESCKGNFDLVRYLKAATLWAQKARQSSSYPLDFPRYSTILRTVRFGSTEGLECLLEDLDSRYSFDFQRVFTLPVDLQTLSLAPIQECFRTRRLKFLAMGDTFLLDWAIITRQLAKVKVLLEYSAELRTTNPDSFSPIHTWLSVDWGLANKAEAQQMLEVLVYSDRAILEALEPQGYKISQTGFDVSLYKATQRDIAARKGATPFLTALSDLKIMAAEMLISAGANIHACDQEGSNGLHILMEGSPKDVSWKGMHLVSYLIDHGVDPCALNMKQETALCRGVKAICTETSNRSSPTPENLFSEKALRGYVEVFLKEASRVGRTNGLFNRDSAGKTPTDYAKRKRDWDLLQILAERDPSSAPHRLYS